MANLSRKIGKKIRDKLISEAGNKCANPGCSRTRVEFHHIKQWAIYKTHDESHMIAICPVCHDDVHNGKLKIDDETLYKWKTIPHNIEFRHSHLYSEPSSVLKILCGAFAVTAPLKNTIFRTSLRNYLGFKIINDERIVLNLKMFDTLGEEIINVVENYVKFKGNDSLDYSDRVGKIRLTAPVSEKFISVETFKKVIAAAPTFSKEGIITLLDIEILKPGLIQVQGIFVEKDKGIVITEDAFIMLHPDEPVAKNIRGAGEDAVLAATEDFIGESIFGFSE